MKPKRQDRVVIMARGRGTRMGGPKGLLRLTPSGPVFVRLIADLYRAAGFQVDVVFEKVPPRLFEKFEVPCVVDVPVNVEMEAPDADFRCADQVFPPIGYVRKGGSLPSERGRGCGCQPPSLSPVHTIV